MSAFFGIIGMLGIPVCLVLLIIKAIRRKPKKKTAIALAIFFVSFVVGLCIPSNSTEEPKEEPAPVVNEATPEPTETPTATPEATTVPDHTEDSLSFELIAGEPGEYGELFTINKDTEFEETYYIFRIPAGTYTVTNIGEYMDQFNVYGDTIHVTDAGWEEFSDIFYVKVLDVGKSDTFTIEEGQIIEIHEPGKFLLEKNDVNDATPETTTTPEPTASMTMGQRNALESAKSYLRFTAFSYEGLIEQLEYEEFSHEDAVFAADNCGADWYYQALKSADDYLSFTAFSYKSLIEQLEYEKFTKDQATYAADNCGADWYEQAAKSAENYLSFTSFSRQGLIDQLKYEGFTQEEAVYGVEANGY